MIIVKNRKNDESMEQEGPPNEQVYLHVTTSFPSVFNNIYKYMDFVNMQFVDNGKSMLYMEPIHEGMLYIFANFSAFELLNQPLSRFELNHLKSMEDLSTYVIIGNNLTQLNFPPTGLFITMKVFATIGAKCIEIITDYFKSFQNPGISLFPKENNTILVLFSSFEAYMLYIKRLARIFFTVITELK